MEHDATLYPLWLLMGLVGLSIGSDRQLGEILRTLRPRVLLAPLATTVGTFAGVAAASLFLTYSLADCLAVGAGFAYYSLSSIFITQYKGTELGTVALLSNILREILTLVGTPLLVRLLGPLTPISCGGASTMDNHPADHRPLRGPGLDFHLHRARHVSGFQRAVLGHLLLHPVILTLLEHDTAACQTLKKS